MVYYAAQMEGQHVSLSALDRRCAHLFFYWDVFNVFLGALFGGTVLGEIQTFLEARRCVGHMPTVKGDRGLVLIGNGGL